MKNKEIILSLLALIVLAPACLADSSSLERDGKHHHLFPNHPRLRRIFKAASFGVVTGGLAAPLLGGAAATGAVVGATTHSTVRGIKDQRDLKKGKHLDNHRW